MRIKKKKKEIEELTYVCEVCGKEYSGNYLSHFVKCVKCGEVLCENCAEHIHILDDMPLNVYFNNTGEVTVHCDVNNDDGCNYLDSYDYALCKKCKESITDEARNEYNKSVEEAVNEFNRKIKEANEKYLK